MCGFGIRGFTVIILPARLLDLWRSYQIFYFRPEHPRRILSLSPRDPPSDPWSPFMSLSLMNSCTGAWGLGPGPGARARGPGPRPPAQCPGPALGSGPRPGL